MGGPAVKDDAAMMVAVAVALGVAVAAGAGNRPLVATSAITMIASAAMPMTPSTA